MADELTTKESMATMGKQIVEIATEQRKRRQSEKIISMVDAEMEAVGVAERKIMFYQECLSKSKARLAAIEAGEFQIINNTFEFHNEDLVKGPFLNPQSILETGISITREVADEFLNRTATLRR